MLGAIAGDIIGSVFEYEALKEKDFTLFSPRASFTDDSVLTIAVADVLMNGWTYHETLRWYTRRFPSRGYGARFLRWAFAEDMAPYYSLGNGSAMRVSPVGWWFDDLETTRQEAIRSAVVTHNHPEGLKGAEAVATAIFLARKEADKAEIQKNIEERFGYILDIPLQEIRPQYCYDVTCPGSVPEAIRAFLEAVDFEDAIRNAISLGGDADTQAAIAGSIAEAYFGEVPEPILKNTMTRLDEDLRGVVTRFMTRRKKR
ncbi:ADP-ribosylglycohydrolase family protein [Magnetococcales bacterium HHB-1]